MASNSETRAACITKFHGPTDHRGSRVSAKHLCTGRQVTLAWDDASCSNHEDAARKLFGCPASETLLCCPIDGGGWVWMRSE